MQSLPQTTIELIHQARTVGSISPSDYQVPFGNIGELLDQRAGESGEKTFLIFYADDAPDNPRSFSYSQFRELVARAASFLLERGIGHGDKIATVAFNHVDTVVQYFAAWAIGAVVVPINVGEDDKRIAYILRNSDVRLAFVRERFLERMASITKERPLEIVCVRENTGEGKARGGGAAFADFHESLLRQTPEIRAAAPSPESEALIVYTSGTTGNPKGVVLTQYNLLIDAKSIAEWHAMSPDQRMMCVLPIHHVNGTIVTLITPMYFGGSVVLNQKFHSRSFFERLSRERAHVASVVPTLLQFLLHENPDVSKLDLTGFRHIICGAGPLTVDLALRFEERFGIPIMHGYGLSETTCYSCFLPLDLPAGEHTTWLREYGFPSIGVPIPCNEMAIHDDLGRALGDGEKGEIVIRGHNVMKEYHANPEANATTFAHGWFRSGDEGFYRSDAKGRRFFFITGRIKELIIRGGSNISPFEIDEVLMNMPGVKAGLAVGFENDWYGEEVGAYVQPHDGTALTEQEVLTYCRKFFSFQKSPKVVVFGNEIPVTSTGKYQRGRLKPLFEKWRGVQFTQS